MKPDAIIQNAACDGLQLSAAADGKLKVTGRETIVTKWLPVLQTHKSDLLAILAVNREPTQSRSNATHSIRDVEDPGCRIAAYHERLAICLADHATKAHANQIASQEVGCRLEVLVRQQLFFWRKKLVGLSIASGPWWANLRTACVASLCEQWMKDAVMLGWTDAELFGIHPCAPKSRIEAMGLVVAVASSKLRPPLRVADLSPADATIVTGTGARLTYRRFHPSIGRPIWLLPELQQDLIH
jgi:hypothetical protein